MDKEFRLKKNRWKIKWIKNLDWKKIDETIDYATKRINQILDI